jgi:uncharacterized protein (DUF305 family)
MTPVLRLLLLPVVALALLLALTSCGQDPAGSEEASSGSQDHNSADVEFATGMIPHHAQALSMVDLTVGRDLSPEVAKLADDIRAAQAPEIEQMTDWLEEWGEPVPETMRDHANAHGSHGDMETPDMPGMMSAEQMTELEKASDAEFEQMFLEMMIDHHEGAVEMARTEQSEGVHEAAVELAGQIEESQTAEIERMQSLLEDA